IGGSQLILKFVERYPVIVYVGSGVLAWTAVKMMTSEPLVKDYLADHGAIVALAHVLVIGGVLGAGFLKKHAVVRERVATHVVDADITPDPAPAGGESTRAGANMWKALIPVDGSANSLKAVRHVVDRYMGNPALEVHVLHVQTPLSQHAARLLNRSTRAARHRDAAEQALAPARALLNQFGVPHAVHIELGDKAEAIRRVAQRLHVDRIVIGTARQSSFTRVLQDSVTNRVLENTQVPVEVVAGDAVSSLERYGLAASVGVAALALVYVTVN
ncbi:MAG TPA: universal stress protein, partial [Burkholderiales bacterium]